MAVIVCAILVLQFYEQPKLTAQQTQLTKMAQRAEGSTVGWPNFDLQVGTMSHLFELHRHVNPRQTQKTWTEQRYGQLNSGNQFSCVYHLLTQPWHQDCAQAQTISAKLLELPLHKNKSAQAL